MRTSTLVFGMLFALCGTAASAAPPTPLIEGFDEVDAKRVDKAWLLPGADFSGYKRVMIDPAEVAFRKNWMRDVNRSHGSGPRVREEDAQKIAAAARDGFNEIFAEAFRKAGYEVVTESAPDVLRLTPAIRDLYIDAPAALSQFGNKIYSVEAGDAVLMLVVSDSPTGAVLGVAVDRREAGDRGGLGLSRMDWRTASSNRNDFERMFKSWAEDSVNGLADLKAGGK